MGESIRSEPGVSHQEERICFTSSTSKNGSVQQAVSSLPVTATPCPGPQLLASTPPALCPSAVSTHPVLCQWAASTPPASTRPVSPPPVSHLWSESTRLSEEQRQAFKPPELCLLVLAPLEAS